MNFINRIKSLFFRKIKHKITRFSDINELKKKGMKIGKNVFIAHNVDFDDSLYFCIEIGDHTIISSYVHILAHDASTLRWLDHGKVGKVRIGEKCFIGLNTIILPNVTIGNNVIVGAGSVVTKDIPDGHVVGGNPAKIICTTEEYINKMKLKMNDNNIFTEEQFNFNTGVGSQEIKNKMLSVLDDGIGFIK